MSMEIILAAVIVGGTGLLLGLFLGLAGKKFAVEIDEKEQQVREQLPGNNCGGCGYAGCDAMAKAIANGEENSNTMSGLPALAHSSMMLGIWISSSVMPWMM